MIGQPYPPDHSRKEIVFVRHAESQANRDGVWNGKSDGPLSSLGEESLEALGERLSDWHFDAVVASPLQRAMRTAESFADEVAVDDRFVEIDLGQWEGMHFADVQERHGEELKAALQDRDRPMGVTGESLNAVAARATSAVDDLFARMGPDERVAVVTHGGFMQSVLHRHLAGDGRRVHSFTANTAITRIYLQYGRTRLATFNDTGHLTTRPASVSTHLDEGAPVVAFIRHGRTRANVEGRWQGQGDWDLDDLGRAQAAALRKWYGTHSNVYTSPLKRAASTAAEVSVNGAVPVPDFMEVNMGKWEGLTTSEIAARWPGSLEMIYRDGKDLPRGETGETWAQLAERFAGGVDDLAHDDGEMTLVVAHGGAIRAYLSSLTETTDTHAESLYTPRNTSVTHVAYTKEGPMILDYAVAPHLETLD